MKVYILLSQSYCNETEDVTVVGVFRKMEDAQEALSDNVVVFNELGYKGTVNEDLISATLNGRDVNTFIDFWIVIEQVQNGN